MSHPFRALELPLWRMLHPMRQRSPMSGEGARLYGGRWNMKGWPALYLATDHATAVAEYYRGRPKPGTLAPYELSVTVIADLTDGRGGPADDAVAQALAADWKTIALLDGQVPPSWTLTQRLIAVGAEGALIPPSRIVAGPTSSCGAGGTRRGKRTAPHSACSIPRRR